MEWTGQVYADCPAVAAQTYIEAPPERVWPLVSDIFLMPGLSGELQEVAWLDGVAGPALGCRFAGRNANAVLGSWETVSTVALPGLRLSLFELPAALVRCGHVGQMSRLGDEHDPGAAVVEHLIYRVDRPLQDGDHIGVEGRLTQPLQA